MKIYATKKIGHTLSVTEFSKYILVCFVKKGLDNFIIISPYSSQKTLTKIDLLNKENACAVSVSDMRRRILSRPLGRMFAL